MLTAGLARKHGARVLLRIDDLDRQRFRESYLQDIFDTLAFAGISWDEGPAHAESFESAWSQVHRMEHYQQALGQLRRTDRLYACVCSRSQLGQNHGDPCACRGKKIPLEREGVRWRLYTEPGLRVTLHDYTDGPSSFALPASVQDAIVRKADGLPAYQLTSVVDDLLYGVDLVVRGADLFASSLFQLHLASLLPANRFRETVFLHHPLLEAPDGRKLSKSAGDRSARQMRVDGLTREGLLELLLRLADGHTHSVLLREAMQLLWGN